MTLEYVLDHIVQYLLVQVVEVFIEKSSYYLTKVVCFFYGWKKSKSNAKSLFNLDIVYQSDNFIVLNKPADLLINSNDNSKNTVQTILRNQLPALINSDLKHEFYFAHRLDFSTSGILCIPLHKQSCTALSRSFEQQKCEKFYIAVVNGHMVKALYDVSLAVGEDVRYEDSSKRMCTEEMGIICKNPRRSRTRIIMLAHGLYKGREVTKILLQPITGRRHQLRLHCAALGHSILGDYTYGSYLDKELPRMYLHAIRLIAPNDVEDLNVSTSDPFTDTSFTFSSEVNFPPILQSIWDDRK